MTVTVTAALNDEGVGLYVPFRGFDRSRGCCGTLMYFDTASGDGSGGGIQIVATATREMFGFHPLLVVRGVNTHDDQAAASDVRVGFEAPGNERLAQGWQVVDRKNVQVGSVNVNIFGVHDFSILIEPSEDTAANVLTFNWETNTNAKVYNARAFFNVYDLQAIGRSGGFVPDGAMLNG